jgi:hypothetical protein
VLEVRRIDGPFDVAADADGDALLRSVVAPMAAKNKKLFLRGETEADVIRRLRGGDRRGAIIPISLGALALIFAGAAAGLSLVPGEPTVQRKLESAAAALTDKQHAAIYKPLRYVRPASASLLTPVAPEAVEGGQGGPFLAYTETELQSASTSTDDGIAPLASREALATAFRQASVASPNVASPDVPSPQGATPSKAVIPAAEALLPESVAVPPLNPLPTAPAKIALMKDRQPGEATANAAPAAKVQPAPEPKIVVAAASPLPAKPLPSPKIGNKIDAEFASAKAPVPAKPVSVPQFDRIGLRTGLPGQDDPQRQPLKQEPPNSEARANSETKPQSVARTVAGKPPAAQRPVVVAAPLPKRMPAATPVAAYAPRTQLAEPAGTPFAKPIAETVALEAGLAALAKMAVDQADRALLPVAPPAAPVEKPTVAPVEKPPVIEPVAAQPEPEEVLPAPIPTDNAQTRRLIAAAQDKMASDDFAAARLFLERAVALGSEDAIMMLAKTYDPAYLKERNVIGLRGDIDKANALYGKAQMLRQ